MRAVLQRVNQASVKIEDQLVAEIGSGWLVFLAVHHLDQQEDVLYMVKKIINLRAFADNQGRFQNSITDISGEILLVSQFTLYGDCRKGRRPSFSESAPIDWAEQLYKMTINEFQSYKIPLATGRFQENMLISLQNQGPATFIIDSPHRKNTEHEY